MSFKIESGTGNGQELGIDKNKRALTKSHSLNSKEYSSDAGWRFNSGSGLITLTSAAESAVYYFKNNEDYDFVITNVFASAGASTSGTTTFAILKVYFSPTGGTLISNAVAAPSPNNFKIGSANELTATVYKGVTGDTATGGTSSILRFFQIQGETNIPADGIIVPKGQSIAISLTPPASNASLPIVVGISGYVNRPIVSGD